MVNRKKNVVDVLNEHEEFEETVRDALKLHDKLLRIGLEGIAEDASKLHDRLLRIKEEKTKKYIGKQANENEEEGRDATLTLTSLFLRDELGHIYGKIGVNKEVSQEELLENEPARGELLKEDQERNTESYRVFMQNIRKSIGIWLDDNLAPMYIDGAVEEVTGYDKDDFDSMNLKWIDLVVPEDQPLVLEHIKWVKLNPNIYAEIEYQIRRKDGETRWIKEITRVVPENQKSQGAFHSFVCDINEQKKTEESKMRFEEAQKKEIHHRIKNNLQVISSLLDLQAENLAGNSVCDTSKVLEAFKESKNRVASMALIHEELYRSPTYSTAQTLDFSAYLTNLTAYLFDSYNIKNDNISLKLNLEQVNLNMDTAIPLGNIVTELISNALKYAFLDESKGEISIILCKNKNYKRYVKKSRDFRTDFECQNIEDLPFVLIVKDNGKGFPKELDFQNTDSLGLQLVNILVQQIDGCIELKRNNGTEFTIWFKDI